MRLDGKVALITGAAGGLGQAFSRALLTAGAQVVLSDINESAGHEALKELGKKFNPEKVIFVMADVTNHSSLEEAFKAAKSVFGRLDIVVNNAGVLMDSEWEREIDINIKGVVNGILLSQQQMGQHVGGAGGVVANLSSMAGLGPVPTLPLYCGTKHAVAAITRAYGNELHFSKTGISVVAICPGSTDTPMIHQAHEFVLHNYLRDKVRGIFQTMHCNKPDFVAEGLVHAITRGKSGSVWLVNNGIIQEVEYPRVVQ